MLSLGSKSKNTMSATDMVQLQSSDGVDFSVPRSVASMSVTLDHMLHDISRSQSDEAIPLPNVNAKALEKVIEYCKHHEKDEPVPASDAAKQEHSVHNISAWDKQFMQVEMGLLFDIILAANFLDIKSLLDLGCKTVASMIIGKTPEEIEQTFRIPTQ